MKMAAKYGCRAAAAALAMLVTACVADKELVPESRNKGTRAYAEVTLASGVHAESRAVLDTYNHWTIASFGPNDETGLVTLKGRQNPENISDFSLRVENERMVYEGRVGMDAYRFGTTEIVIDPETVNSDASFMYYPYFADMPSADDKSGLAGMPLRRTDDGIEKCIDFMTTMSPTQNVVTAKYRLTLTNGVLTPKFYHYFTMLILQRGEGFRNAPDKRMWVVMKNPYTDIKFKITYSNYNFFGYYLQYTPDAFEPEGADLMVDLHSLPKNRDGDDEGEGDDESGDGEDDNGSADDENPFNVNKYALWETWEGGAHNSIESRYVVIPPSEEVFFVYIQDDYGTWQKVSDFKLADGKSGDLGYRYVLTIKLVGTKAVVRPVSIVPWNDEINIADIRKVGIDDYSEYYDWVSTYNAYIESGRNDSYVESLSKYGDATLNTETGDMSWSFYINNDLTFRDDHMADFAQVKLLEDAIEGSSTYINYSISNIRNTMVAAMGAGGAIRALDFKDVYLVQAEQSDPQPYGALVGEMRGGTIERCNILNGVLVSTCEVGMMAGRASGGEVRGCTVSGNVIGSSTADGYYGLFGTVEGNSLTVVNNRTAGLQFIEN